jgi:hypothetical protein
MPEPTSNEPDDGGRSTDDGGGSEMRLVRSFGVTRRVPDGVLSPEAVARLRAGGELTPEELARVRAAALGEGPLGRLVGGLLAEGEGARPGDAREAVHGADDDAPDTVIVPGNLRRFEFEWRPKDRREEAEPTTYYEALPRDAVRPGALSTTEVACRQRAPTPHRRRQSGQEVPRACRAPAAGGWARSTGSASTPPSGSRARTAAPPRT